MMSRPRTDREQAAADLIAQAQVRIQAMMMERGWRQADLANAMSVSVARISHLLGHRANPTLETIAYAFHALGDVAEVTSDGTKRLEAYSLCQGELPTFVGNGSRYSFGLTNFNALLPCLHAGVRCEYLEESAGEDARAGRLALAA